MARVLIAEDDATLLKILQGLLSGAGHEVEATADGRDAYEAYEAANTRGETPDMVLADINMPRMDGLELIDELKLIDPHVVVVFVTAYSSVESAVSALRKGAFDYVTKPFRNDRLLQVVQNAVTHRQLFRENRTLRRELEQTYGFTEIVGRSPGMSEVLRIVERAAPSQSSLLIRGETGTGKELVARALHHASLRGDRPFVSLNCAALPEGLLESELFGHEKGAFTGAVRSSEGLFRSAHGGTLFLDEVGEMSPALQAKLLRVLETREVRPVGSTESIEVDVRIVAATHRELLEDDAVEFREDLFYRLAVIEVELPPLRRRPEDVPLLVRHFLRRLARERQEPERELTAETLALFQRYPWPGNVRELLNAIEHAVTLGGEVLTPDDLPSRVRRGAREAKPLRQDDDEVLTLAELERRHVERMLAQVGGDRRRAAERLGIDLSTLYRKLKRWRTDEDG
jgi:DNA-binding NtrC family response regulator